MLTRPVFPDEELGKVRSEVLTALRQEADSTRSVALRETRRLLYPAGHPYHVWESGTEQAVAALTRDDLIACHHAALRPERTVVVIVGDVDPAGAVAAVTDRFAAWRPPGTTPPWPTLTAAPPTATVTHDVAMSNKTQCDLILASTGVARTDPDYYRLAFATSILGQLGFMGRFGKTVRDELGLAYYCFAQAQQAHGSGMWFCQAGVDPRNVMLAADTMTAQMRLMQEELVTEPEHDQLRHSLLGSLAMLLDTRSSMAQALLAIEQWNLGADYYDRYEAIVRGVSREDIREAARAYFPPDRHVRVVVGPRNEA